MQVSAPRSEIEEMEGAAESDARGESQDDCLFNMVMRDTELNNNMLTYRISCVI